MIRKLGTFNYIKLKSDICLWASMSKLTENLGIIMVVKNSINIFYFNVASE